MILVANSLLAFELYKTAKKYNMQISTVNIKGMAVQDKSSIKAKSGL
jgi:hypothetical protein